MWPRLLFQNSSSVEDGPVEDGPCASGSSRYIGQCKMVIYMVHEV